MLTRDLPSATGRRLRMGITIFSRGAKQIDVGGEEKATGEGGGCPATTGAVEAAAARSRSLRRTSVRQRSLSATASRSSAQPEKDSRIAFHFPGCAAKRERASVRQREGQLLADREVEGGRALRRTPYVRTPRMSI
jgi:hypothetical protein